VSTEVSRNVSHNPAEGENWLEGSIDANGHRRKVDIDGLLVNK